MDYTPLQNTKGSATSSSTIVDDFMYGSNVATAHVYVRLAFLRKVYGILSVQLGLTTLIGALIMMTPSVSEYVKANNWIFFTSSISTIFILIALMVKRTEYPANYYLLTAFTLVEAFTVGIVASFFDKFIVIEAFLITTTLVICLTVYTLQTKRDFSSMGASLFTFLWILILGGVLQLVFQHTLFEFAIGLFGALLFSLFIIYDTQMIMKHLNPEEYIVGVINLYLDIINLFLEILRILDSLKRN